MTTSIDKADAYSVCAIIVTYHPSVAMAANLSKVLEQVQGLVVVDNGSTPEELATVRAACQQGNDHLIENGENLGIAEALNRGVQWATGQGFPWVIFLDQDSQMTDGFIEKMFAAWRRCSDRNRIAAIQPTYWNPETKEISSVYRAKDGGPVSSFTSGSLMPTWIFDKIGLFEPKYFIDFVDTEYCFRIRQATYRIIDSTEAVMIHSRGDAKNMSFLWFKWINYNYSPMRRYYISRNCVVFSRKYIFHFPRWTLYCIYGVIKDTVKCILAEHGRLRNLHNVVLGLWDGAVGRMGKREGV